MSSVAPTASAIGRTLDLDAGYLSRVLRNFEKRGLIQRRVSASDARQSHLALSARGRRSFAPLDRRSQRDTQAMLRGLAPADQNQPYWRETPLDHAGLCEDPPFQRSARAEWGEPARVRPTSICLTIEVRATPRAGDPLGPAQLTRNA